MSISLAHLTSFRQSDQLEVLTHGFIVRFNTTSEWHAAHFYVLIHEFESSISQRERAFASCTVWRYKVKKLRNKPNEFMSITIFHLAFPLRFARKSNICESLCFFAFAALVQQWRHSVHFAFGSCLPSAIPDTQTSAKFIVHRNSLN